MIPIGTHDAMPNLVISRTDDGDVAVVGTGLFYVLGSMLPVTRFLTYSFAGIDVERGLSVCCL